MKLVKLFEDEQYDHTEYLYPVLREFFGCTEKDDTKMKAWIKANMVDGWLDDENEDKAAISALVSDTNSETEPVKVVKHPEFKFMTTHVLKIGDIYVIEEMGQPDSMWWRKSDQAALLKLTQKED